MSETADSGEAQAIVPVREQIVDFYGDELLAAEGPDATVYVPLHLICDYLGLNWPGQFERTRRHPVLAGGIRYIRVTRMNSPGGNPNVLALPLSLLPGWLFGISAERVRPALREKILRYQAECFQVLWHAFQADILPQPTPAPTKHGAELAVEITGALYALAQQQLALEQRVDTLAERTDALAHVTDRRLSALEVRLDPKQVITEEQAAELALAVKAVGKALEGQGDRQGYAKVYSELYRRYRISSYKNLPQARYAEVLAWLHAWHQELTGPA